MQNPAQIALLNEFTANDSRNPDQKFQDFCSRSRARRHNLTALRQLHAAAEEHRSAASEAKGTAKEGSGGKRSDPVLCDSHRWKFSSLNPGIMLSRLP